MRNARDWSLSAKALVETVKKRKRRRAVAFLERGSPRRVPTGTGERMLDCATYEACLDFAVTKGWPGFTCAKCSEYQASSSITVSAVGIASSIAMQKTEKEV